MSTANLNVVVDPKTKQLVKRAAKADKRTMSGLIEKLIHDHCPSIIQQKRRDNLSLNLDDLLAE